MSQVLASAGMFRRVRQESTILAGCIGLAFLFEVAMIAVTAKVVR